MTRKGNEQHKEVLKNAIADLEFDGYRVIELEGKSPDAIAVKADSDGKIEVVALDIIGKTYRPKKGWHGSWSHAAKQKTYHMFDRLIIRTFKRNTKYTKGGPPYPNEH